MFESPEGNSEPEKSRNESSEVQGSPLAIKDFEEALNRLEEIVRRLEAGDLSLEEAMRLFEEGMRLSAYCSNKLDEADRRVEILVRNARGRLETKPFTPGDSDDRG